MLPAVDASGRGFGRVRNYQSCPTLGSERLLGLIARDPSWQRRLPFR